MSMHDARTNSLSGRNEDLGSLAERIKCHIENRLPGRIHYLKVFCFDDLILLQGRSQTYHARQLAQDEALALTDGTQRPVNQILVY